MPVELSRRGRSSIAVACRPPSVVGSPIAEPRHMRIAAAWPASPIFRRRPMATSARRLAKETEMIETARHLLRLVLAGGMLVGLGGCSESNPGKGENPALPPVVLFPAFHFTILEVTAQDQSAFPECPASGTF